MSGDRYTLAELARLVDVTPRTVRYYVHQGLLPPPEPAGPATRYGDHQLTRLRLIRRLQREHLPLAEIRARLEQMDDAQVELALAGEFPDIVAPAMSTEETLAFVRQLMTRAGVAPRFYETPAPPASDRFVQAEGRGVVDRPGPMSVGRFEPVVPDEFPLRDPPEAPDPAAPPASRPATPFVPPVLPGALPARRRGTGRSTWERIEVAPDVELHVRRPLDRRSNKRVDQLVRIARELFEEDA